MGITKHGMSRSPEYRSWSMMKDRCLNPRGHAFSRYGGRGIKVCDRWLSFDNFIDDMGTRPSLSHSLDRIDTNGNYCPENCRWANIYEQNRNRRDIELITFRGETLCPTEWVSRLGIKRTTVRYRLAQGWSIERALTEKPMSLAEAGRLGRIARKAKP